MAAVSMCLTVVADDFSWSSGSGSVWSNGSNWTQTPVDNGAVPGPSDNVISPATTTFIQIDPAVATVQNWTYSSSGSGAQLVVANSGNTTLQITGTMSLTAGAMDFRNSGSSELDIEVGHLDVSGSDFSAGHNFGIWDSDVIRSFTANTMNVSGGFVSFKVGDGSGTATINNTLTMSGSGAVEVRWSSTSAETGTLAVGGLSSVSSANAIRVHHGSADDNGILQLNNDTGITTSYAGILEDGGNGGNVLSVEKNNAGTQVFTGNANTYTGGTTIHGGTLLFNNTSGSGTGTGPVVVNASGILGGTGRIAPTGANGITVNTAGLITPGAGLETLELDLSGTTGGLTMNAGSGFTFELGTAGLTIADPVSGVNSGTLLLTGASAGDVAFNGNEIDFSGTGEEGWYKLFDTDLGSGSTWTGLSVSGQEIVDGLSVANLASGLTGTLVLGNGVNGDADDIYLLAVTAIPEPASLVLVMLGLGLAVVGCRKRS